MTDPDVFAILTPGYGYEGERAKTTFGQHYNTARYRGQTQEPILTEPLNHSRESTPGLTPPCIQKTDSCLELRFSDSMINPANGLVFGKDERSSDVMIQCPGVRGVSRQHFSIIAKEDGSWYLEDFYSRFGTSVSYDGRGALHRRNRERWILAHPPGESKHWNELIVSAGNVAFRISFINQQAGHPAYVANLKAFISDCREAIPTLGVLGLESHDTTVAPSHIASPDQSRLPIYIDFEEVGQGAFATVLKVMSCRNGVFYAKKTFSRPTATGGNYRVGRKREWDSEAWFDIKRKEADIMKRNVHPNVMPLISVIEESDSFSIVMPLYISGSLQDYRPTNEAHAYESVFLQILLVLDWLHSRGVVHRDIKPENFLIEQEEPLKIIVADFGLSKVSIDQLLTTFCGTLLYCAPEVFPGNSRGYGPKADMWSLGVMMVNLLFGLPDSPFLPPCHNHNDLCGWIDDWSERLNAELHKLTNDNELTDILLEIIKVDPEQRLTAAECLQKGLDTGLFRIDHHNQIVLFKATGTHSPLNDSSQSGSTEELTGRSTPAMQSSQLLKIVATGEPTGISFLDEGLWDSCSAHEGCNRDQVAPRSISPNDSDSTSGPPRRRQKIHNSFSHPNSVEGTNSGMERPAEIRSKFDNPLAPTCSLEKRQSTCIQRVSLESGKAENAPAENESWGSVERRVFEMLA